MHNTPNYAIIPAMNDKTHAQTAMIGSFGPYMVYIQTDDTEQIPSFHVVDSVGMAVYGSQTFHIQLAIRKPYIVSGDLPIPYPSFLAALNHFLGSRPARKSKHHAPTITNWDKVLFEWNDNNQEHQVDEDTPQPDYRVCMNP